MKTQRRKRSSWASVLRGQKAEPKERLPRAAKRVAKSLDLAKVKGRPLTWRANVHRLVYLMRSDKVPRPHQRSQIADYLEEFADDGETSGSAALANRVIALMFDDYKLTQKDAIVRVLKQFKMEPNARAVSRLKRAIPRRIAKEDKVSVRSSIPHEQ
jgi:hypothetical protein